MLHLVYVLITSDEQTYTLIKGLNLLKSWFNPESFYGKGSNGPTVFMTDNCAELRDVLRNVFPNSDLFLCTFHILQQVWRWLKDSNHGVRLVDMPPILSLFKAMVFAKTQAELEASYLILIENTFSYPNFQTYIESLYDIKESWACCYRVNKLIRGSNTNNYVESQFNVIKDGIFKRYSA